ncbi:hypothetical protein AOXY_G3702 [Acipenser oxyrinchus oxyrinchus]|uniref:PHD-type domain-containing protein n=1 Tax=Acipenser oxyrinchus oxyrinchus TaxID=40147 RepID=A0AAD8GG15_ACIOX|nr:hypothetical protein AOXY_G3702 [Acipenser oxyrinchus oxyrinchus]
MSAPYRTQTNGLVEKMNGVIQRPSTQERRLRRCTSTLWGNRSLRLRSAEMLQGSLTDLCRICGEEMSMKDSHEEKEDRIVCDGCSLWFHLDCINPQHQPKDVDIPFFIAASACNN